MQKIITGLNRVIFLNMIDPFHMLLSLTHTSRFLHMFYFQYLCPIHFSYHIYSGL